LIGKGIYHIRGEDVLKATEILMEEHRVIERVLNALERASNRLSRGEDVYLRFFTGTAVFIKSFADGCHHKKEELVLFPAMVKNGLSTDSGPIAVMLAEHEEGRRLAQGMRMAAERFQAGDIRMREGLVNNARAYINLLHQHIAKEDKVLFPMANKIIPPAEQEEILSAFEKYERDDTGDEMHAKYYGLAERLEKECLR
jgi:hemerythrin-like domain-containing protein